MLIKLIKPSKVDRLQLEIIRRQISPPFLSLYRNMSFGTTAICLGLLIGIAQVGAKSWVLEISVFCASAALPLWFLLGVIFECYLVLGEQSHEHLRTRFARGVVLVIWFFACAPLGVAVAGVIYFLNEGAFLLFAGSAVAAMLIYLGFNFHMASWWYAPNGPGSTEGSPSSPPASHQMLP